MTKAISDIPLHNLANKLTGIIFPDEEKQMEFLAADKIASNHELYHITPPAKRIRWLVRFYFGGKYRYIGATERAADAMRFADMAAVRFNKYRKRSAVSPALLNFSPEQVDFDETACPLASQLLGVIEQYLLDNHIIALPGAEKIVPRKFRGLKSDILFLHEEMLGRISALSNQITELRRDVSQLRVMRGPAFITCPPSPGSGYVAPYIGDPPPGPGLAPVFTCKSLLDGGNEVK